MISIEYKTLTYTTHKMDLLIPQTFPVPGKFLLRGLGYYQLEKHWSNISNLTPPHFNQLISKTKFDALNYFNDSFKYPIHFAYVTSFWFDEELNTDFNWCLDMDCRILCFVIWQTEFWYHNSLRSGDNYGAYMKIM